MVKVCLPSNPPPNRVFRIARGSDPWQPPDWANAHEDRTFGNRFDDSEGYFRVLYAGSTRLACFIETLARYRTPLPAQDVLSVVNRIEGSIEDHISAGTVPGSWLGVRTIGSAILKRTEYADVYSSEWLSYIRRTLEHDLFMPHSESNPSEFDLTLLLSQHRGLTQKVATLAYKEGYAGICYHSRYGKDLINWALFEPFEIERIMISQLRPHDVDFQQALKLLNLKFDPTI